MPTIFVNGPKVDLDKKRAIVKGITDVIASVYEKNRDEIVVVIREDEGTNVAKGGELLCDMVK